MSKLDDCLALLRAPGGEDRSNPDIAKEVGCNEGHVRRARAVLRAEQTAAEESDDPDESTRLLADILSKHRARAQMLRSIADTKADLKAQQESLKDFEKLLNKAVATATESHPLFDGLPSGDESEQGASGPRLASAV